MKRLILLIFVVVVSAVFAGCATFGQPAGPKDLSTLQWEASVDIKEGAIPSVSKLDDVVPRLRGSVRGSATVYFGPDFEFINPPSGSNYVKIATNNKTRYWVVSVKIDGVDEVRAFKLELQSGHQWLHFGHEVQAYLENIKVLQDYIVKP
ncbi:hypothetical protein AGMMS50268_00670 [Spirochaetia bacterium]|nr:hypothetical protein AGMMS50268_00670 [Spirochaetia bacterium]